MNDFGGDWDSYVKDCYRRYQADFYSGQDRPWPIDGQKLQLKRHPLGEDGWCNTFWHITTEGMDEANRTPDLARLQCIGWPMAILLEFKSTYPSAASDRVCWWVSRQRRNENRFVLATVDFSYVVVVADRGAYVLLWTAYPVEHAHRRRKLRTEYEAYWANGS